MILKALSLIGMYFLTSSANAHEPWLLTPQQELALKASDSPLLFTTLNYFNMSIVILLGIVMLLWIFFNIKYPEARPTLTLARRNLALLAVRIGVGSSLLLLSIGLIPRIGIAYFSQATLLAPEFLLTSLDSATNVLLYLQLAIALSYIIGLFIRSFSLLLCILVFCVGVQFGSDVLFYAGFYLAVAIVLATQGAGRYSIEWVRKTPHLSLISFDKAIFITQMLTGFTLIYSAIAIKFLHPNIDIGMLEINKAFTFYIPYDYFTFIMFVTEISFGLAIILGYRLRLISSLLLGLFVFLSIDLSENLLAHNFIYGILVMFMLTQGRNFNSKP